MRHVKAEINRYLLDGLPAEEEARLRAHLRSCGECRDHYDRQVLLLRALAGDPDSPTPRERNRQVRLALRAAGLDEFRGSRDQAPGLRERIRWIRLPALAGAALLIVLLAISLGYFLDDIAGNPSARLTKAVAVTLNDTGVDPKALHRSPIHDGQQLEVGQSGIAELRLNRGGTVRVYPGTVLVFKDSGRRLDLGGGKVWCLVETTGIPFRIRTDLADVRVVGTSFVVERTRTGRTEVRVMQGRVEVTRLEKRERVLLKGGWQTRLARGRSLDRPRRYRPAGDRSEWDRKVDELWRDIKRTFRRVKKYFENR